MSNDQDPQGLDQLLDKIQEAAEQDDRVSWGAVTDLLGRRSFGSLLTVVGLTTLAPVIGDIPGVPTILGITVILIAGQILAGRADLWLPRWLLQRSAASHKVDKGVKWSRKPARFIDRLLGPRLPIFVEGAAPYVIAAACVAIGLMMPIMEFVPFSANAAGIILTLFGLSLIACDGLMALLGLILTAATIGVVVYVLL